MQNEQFRFFDPGSYCLILFVKDQFEVFEGFFWNIKTSKPLKETKVTGNENFIPKNCC